jgi:hypothetical protein
MDKEILKQLDRGAIEGSELPALSKEETELYVSHLYTGASLQRQPIGKGTVARLWLS